MTWLLTNSWGISLLLLCLPSCVARSESVVKLTQVTGECDWNYPECTWIWKNVHTSGDIRVLCRRPTSTSPGNVHRATFFLYISLGKFWNPRVFYQERRHILASRKPPKSCSTKVEAPFKLETHHFLFAFQLRHEHCTFTPLPHPPRFNWSSLILCLAELQFVRKQKRMCKDDK